MLYLKEGISILSFLYGLQAAMLIQEVRGAKQGTAADFEQRSVLAPLLGGTPHALGSLGTTLSHTPILLRHWEGSEDGRKCYEPYGRICGEGKCYGSYGLNWERESRMGGNARTIWSNLLKYSGRARYGSRPLYGVDVLTPPALESNPPQSRSAGNTRE